jgi:streptogramin lyase
MRAGPLVSPRAPRRGSAKTILLALMIGLVALLTTGGMAAGQAGSVSDVTYTLDADFQKGTLVNVNHDAPNSNQLQLNAETSTFPSIWVSLSLRCTIAKINTETGAILGEYRTIADGASCNESSRTTVGLDGSVWVGHRGPGGATHVGSAGSNQCIDRNGNGSIETSTGYGDVKPWTGDTSVVANAQDECIIHHVDTDSVFSGFSDTRHMSIDANNNLWIGSFNSGGEFIRVNGTTGAVETPVKDLPCGGYGGLIDGNGIIWSAQGSLLRWDPNAPDSAGTNPQCISTGHSVYGVAVDSNGFIWTSQLGGGEVRKTSPDGATTVGPFFYGNPQGAQGLAAAPNGDIWVSGGLSCSSPCAIGHLKNNGDPVGAVPNPTGTGSTGVAVDAAGKIWTANRSSNTATRIDPNAGPLGLDGVTHVGAVDLTVDFPAGPDGRPAPAPYNYSDMTGAQLLSATAPQGTWTVVQDGGAAGTQWNKILWNTEAQGSVPAGTSIGVEARAADTQAALGSQTFSPVTNAAQLSLTGRFIEVRATLRPSDAGTSPVLSDIRVCEVGGCQAGTTTTPPPAAQTRRPTARVAGVPSTCVRGSFNARIRIRAAGELRRVRVTLNGRRVMSTRRKSFSVRIPARTLRSGRYRLRVVATDSLGRTVRITRTFRRCARPAQQREVPTFTG